MSTVPGAGMAAVMPRTVEAVLFDLGGTCVAIDHERVGRALAGAGIELDGDWVGRSESAGRAALEHILRQGGSPRDQYRAFWEGMLLAAGAAPADLDPLFAELEAWHRKHHLWSRVMPGMPETLRALAGRGYRIAAISNSDGRAEWLLGRLGLAQEFEFVVDSHEVGVEKPDARIFAVACARLGLTPERCAYVGDVVAVDVDGARAAGLWPVLLDVYGAYDADIQPRAAEPAQLLALFPPRPGRDSGRS